MSSFKTFQQTIAAKALDASHVEATFENGSTAILDLSVIKGQGPWAKLQGLAFFERAHAAFGTIVWPDGIDRESLLLSLPPPIQKPEKEVHNGKVLITRRKSAAI